MHLGQIWEYENVQINNSANSEEKYIKYLKYREI